MQYTGSKKTYADEITNAMISHIKSSGIDYKAYIEPFCGSLSILSPMMEKLGTDISYVASDTNYYLIDLWNAVKSGKYNPPDHVTKDQFQKMKDGTFDKIYIGHAMSLRGIYKCTFIQEKNLKLQSDRVRNIGKQLKKHKTTLHACSYESYTGFTGCIFYLDAPYIGTQNQYYIGDERNSKFDHQAYIDWIRELAKTNLVFISEYTKLLPESKLVWESTRGKSQEKLFLVKSKKLLKK